MAAKTLSDFGPGGSVEGFTAASAGGDTFPLPTKIQLRFKNAAGAGRTVTLVGQRPCNHGVVHNQPVAVADATTKVVIVEDVNRFRDEAGLIHLTYDNEAGLTVEGSLLQ